MSSTRRAEERISLDARGEPQSLFASQPIDAAGKRVEVWLPPRPLSKVQLLRAAVELRHVADELESRAKGL